MGRRLYLLCHVFVLGIIALSVESEHAKRHRQKTRRLENDLADCQVSVDLAFLIDTSSSVGDEDFRLIREFIVQLLSDIGNHGEDRVRVALLTYSSRVTIQFNLDDFRTLDDTTAAIRAISRQTGSTNTADALLRMRTSVFSEAHGDRPGVPNVAIVMTDGVSNLNAERTVTEALRCKAAGILIFSLGIGLTGRTPELQLMCTPPDHENLMVVDGFADLQHARRRIVSKLCKLIVTEQLKNTTMPQVANGDHPYCEYPYDIAFLIHSSNQSSPIFAQIRNYLDDHISEVDPQLVRIAAVKNDVTSTTVLSYFEDSLITEDNKNAYMSHIVDETDNYVSSTGVGVLHKRVFSDRFGDRENIPNIAVFILDGPTGFQNLVRESRRLKADGIHVITIAINFTARERNVQRISSLPSDVNTMFITNVTGLHRVHATLTTIICNVARTKLLETTQGNPERGVSENEAIIKEEIIGGITTYPLPPLADCNGIGDIIMVVDSSGSVGRVHFHKAMEFVKIFAKYLSLEDGGHRLALVTFSDHARILYRLTDYQSLTSFQRTCDDAEFVYGSTNMASALQTIRLSFVPMSGPPTRPMLVVIITDGLSNMQSRRTVPVARELKSLGVFIMALAVDLRKTYELEKMVTPPLSVFLHHIPSYDSLSIVLVKLIPPLCSERQACEPSPCNNSNMCFAMMEQFQCRCNYGWTGPTCDLACPNATDVIFLLESSSSVGKRNFNKMAALVHHVITTISIETCPFRFGVVKYGSTAIMEIPLDGAVTVRSLVGLLEDVGFSDGRFYPADAIRVARNDLLTGRVNTRKITMLFTSNYPTPKTELLTEVQRSRIDDITVVPVSIGPEVEHNMEMVASSPNASFTVAQFNQLDELRSDMVSFLLSASNACADIICQNGGTCRERASQPFCVCPPQWFGMRCQTQCKPRADIIFGIDASSYMSSQRLARVRTLFTYIIDALLMLTGDIRIGITSLSRRVRIEKEMSGDLMRAMLLQTLNDMRVWRYREINAFYYDDIIDMFKEKQDDNDHNRDNTREIFIMLVAEESVDQIDLRYLSNVGIDAMGFAFSPRNHVPLKFYFQPRIPFVLPVYEQQGKNKTQEDAVMEVTSLLCDDADQCWHQPCFARGQCFDGDMAFTCTCFSRNSGQRCQKDCPTKSDIVILLDSSGSVGRENFNKMKLFVINLIKELDVSPQTNRISVVSYSTQPHIAFYLNSFDTLEEISLAVSGIEYIYGDTNIADTFVYVKDDIFQAHDGDRESAMNIIILITDGVSNMHAADTVPQAERLREEDVVVMGIGIGLYEKQELLRIVGVENEANALFVDSFDELENTRRTLLAAICSDGSGCDVNPCEHGATCEKYMHSFRCRCREGYAGQHCQIDCSTGLDLAFVIDSSSSLGEDNFRLVVDFVANISSQLDRRKIHTAVVFYSNRAKVIKHLNNDWTSPELLEILNDLTYENGDTNTADALRMLVDDVFTIQNGDRGDIPNKVLLITDGVSNVKPENTIIQAQRLHDLGVAIHVIGVQLNDDSEVSMIANENQVYLIDNYKRLPAMLEDMTEIICNDHI